MSIVYSFQRTKRKFKCRNDASKNKYMILQMAEVLLAAEIEGTVFWTSFLVFLLLGNFNKVASDHWSSLQVLPQPFSQAEVWTLNSGTPRLFYSSTFLRYFCWYAWGHFSIAWLNFSRAFAVRQMPSYFTREPFGMWLHGWFQNCKVTKSSSHTDDELRTDGAHLFFSNCSSLNWQQLFE